MLKRDDPGYFKVSETGNFLKYNCPCGCGDVGILLLEPEGQWKSGQTPARWAWDQNRNIPTLSPSIRRVGGCNFHGFLKKGTWEACTDGPPLAMNVYQGAP